MSQIKTEKLIHYFTLMVLAVSFSWTILPILLLRGDYCFTIHDGLDSYACTVQFIHDNKLYFHLNQNLPIMNGLEGKYTFLGYTLYDFYNCMFGYLTGQILTRITGVLLGFFSLKHLLERLYPRRSQIQSDFIYLLSVAYVVTPVAPNRMIGFASLPLVIEFFLYLRNKSKPSKWSFIGLVLPVLSLFSAIFMFVLGFWVLFGLVDWFKCRKFKINTWLCFAFMCVSTVIVNINYVKVALQADATNRGLLVKESFIFNWDIFKRYLINGQYHSSAYHQRILLPVLLIVTAYVVYLIIKYKEKHAREYVISIFTLSTGWIMWITSALILTLQESGLKTGILVIDGFQWGRVIGFMRILWFLMLASVFYLTQRKKFVSVILYITVCFQLINIAFIRSSYNDTFFSVYSIARKTIKAESNQISYKEFFSEKLFDEIKEDIDYSGEGVAAYGYHPSVLLFNNFNTIDGYFSVHSMEWQNQFREIIEPALDRYENYKRYYDTWGGRMYLFGDIGYAPTKDKNRSPADIFINTDAYKKYGGKYILSVVEIANAEEQKLKFINDYDNENSMYHIWLYEAI